MNMTLTPIEAIAEQHFLRDAAAKFWLRKWSILVIGLGLFAILAVGILAWPKTYQGIAMVEADVPAPQALPQWAMLRDQQFSDYTLGSEMTILQSQELLTAVIKKLNLDQDPYYNPSLKPSAIHDITAGLSSVITDWLPNNQKLTLDVADVRVGETLSGLLKKLKFEPIPRSRDIKIISNSYDNRLAALVANTIADLYIANHLEFAKQITARAHTYADANLLELRDQAANKAKAVADFQIAHGIVTGREATLLQEQISQVSVDRNNAQAQLEILRGKANAARGSKSPETLAAVLGSQTIQKLREQQAAVEAQRAGLSTNYVSGSQLMGRLNAQAADIASRITAEANRMVQSINSDIQAQEAQVATLTHRLSELQKQVSDMTSALAVLSPMKQESDVANQMYQASATTIRQTDASMFFPATTVRVVSKSAIPITAAFPDNAIMMPAAFFLAFGASFVVGWTRETRRKGVVSMYEVEAALDIETLGMLPYRNKHTESVYLDQVEQLYNRLMLVDEPPKSILVTSAQEQEGKTTTALALAQAGAARNLRVLLLNADMRTGRLANRNITTLGLGDVLRGHASVTDVLRRDANNLMVMPAGDLRGMPTRMLASEQFNSMFRNLITTYDLIIVDAPPAFVGGDCWVLSQKVDRTLFIAKWGQTTPRQINEALRKQLGRARLAGIVLNMVDPSAIQRYGYSDAVYLSAKNTRYYGSRRG